MYWCKEKIILFPPFFIFLIGWLSTKLSKVCHSGVKFVQITIVVLGMCCSSNFTSSYRKDHQNLRLLQQRPFPLDWGLMIIIIIVSCYSFLQLLQRKVTVKIRIILWRYQILFKNMHYWNGLKEKRSDFY